LPCQRKNERKALYAYNPYKERISRKMVSIGVKKFANAYKDEYWGNFSKCFPVINLKRGMFENIPIDVLSSLVGLLGEEQLEKWLNYEIEELDKIKPIDLLKTDDGLKALKMYILSMPN